MALVSPLKDISADADGAAAADRGRSSDGTQPSQDEFIESSLAYEQGPAAHTAKRVVRLQVRDVRHIGRRGKVRSAPRRLNPRPARASPHPRLS